MPRTKGRGIPALGTRLASVLASQSISESELAARSGVSQSYISRILTGEVTNPTIEFVVRIAEALGITVDVLLTDADFSPTTDSNPATREELLADIDRTIRRLQALFDQLRRSEQQNRPE